MRVVLLALFLAFLASLSLVLVASAAKKPASPAQVVPQKLAGWSLYVRYCLACHGAKGDGRGPAAPFAWGDPRNFTKGAYEWRTTAFGQAPTDADLRLAIRYGEAGTSMPGFADVLTDPEVANLIEVVKAFDPKTFATVPTPITIGPARPADPDRGAHLWQQHGCDKCHGATGRGDVKGLTEAPYDLTVFPLRRPRDADDLESRRRAAVLSIATGLSGTPMPGFAGPVTEPELWALADHVVALGAKAARTDRSALDASTIEADRAAKLAIGSWPGTDVDEARVFGTPVREQGAAPAELAPAEASLRSNQCARCHAKQAREWTGTVHSLASTWGLSARELDHASDDATSCNRCHTPLAEQQTGTQAFDSELRAEGVTCAGCHVRDWVRRGPPNRAPSLLPATGYPLVELAIYERSDFCMSCHQLPPRTAVNGKPLLNTYKEWLEGPYMRRGIQCQHCHMPNREHTWLGIHDKATFRQGIKLAATARRTAGKVTVETSLQNVGAGHYLPTTPTPAVWLRIELFDAAGTAITGARAEQRIGRDIEAVDGGWREHADTRIPPGETRSITRGWTAGRTAAATTARITVEVSPDDFYERLYTRRLATKLPAATRTAYEASLARARSSHYVAEQITVPIALSSKQ
jgi:mono/diheme cytochrome c family protein